MKAYEVYAVDKNKGHELLGVLPERRIDPKRITRESVIKWGKILLGSMANYKGLFIKKISYR